MVKRWLLYLAALAGCLIFYFAYREWFSYILLLTVASIPWLSLLVSLPVMLTARLQVELPPAIMKGTYTVVRLSLHSRLPLPQWRLRMVAKNLLWGKDWVLRPGGDFPVEHCGTFRCRITRFRVCDYLGMFALPRRAPAVFTVSVRPAPIRPHPAPDVEKYLAQSWRPKAGGGFSENHELRLYRPGDHLKQIHWKLSAKTGELIFREPMIPQGGRMLLWLYHSGDPQILDRKLGQLLWVSGYLRRLGLQHDILAYTSAGARLWHIGTEYTLIDVMDALLSTPPVTEDPEPTLTEAAAWQFYIGGDSYEKV